MRDHVFLYVNGEPVEVRGTGVFETLARFLRYHRGATGTKIVCDEGDCGACTVLVGRADGDRLAYRPVNACIQQLHQLDQTHVVSVEGLSGSARPGAHPVNSPVQQTMMEHHGAQCGYCTPGFIVALAALFEKGDELSESDVREGLVGNLCRCTGYEPIMKAALAVDSSAVENLNDRYAPDEMIAAFARLGPIFLESDGRCFASPDSLRDAIRFKAEHEATVIIQGGTDVGVWCNKRHFEPDAVLSLVRIPELKTLEISDGRLVVGGTVSLHELEQFVRDLAPPLHRILRLFGSPQIRHAGTLAGNVANASPIADTLPFLYVMEAEVELTGLSGTRLVHIRSFYKGYKVLDMQPDELITRILIPLPGENDVLKLYKVSKRQDLDISTFTAALLMRRRDDVIENIRIAYGGVGPVVFRLARTEGWLSGRPFDPETLSQAGEIARQEITPITDVRGSRDFRLLLAETILQKFYHECAEVYA